MYHSTKSKQDHTNFYKPENTNHHMTEEFIEGYNRGFERGRQYERLVGGVLKALEFAEREGTSQEDIIGAKLAYDKLTEELPVEGVPETQRGILNNIEARVKKLT